MKQRTVLLLLASALLISPLRVQSQEGGKTTGSAILVELFTSEGCSSCPPADALLRRLDQSAMASGNHVIVLSEHVDYWDGLGWRDRFSSREYTDRQSEYARRLNINSPYTPQMVVDGTHEFVGNDARALQDALREDSGKSKVSIAIQAKPAGQSVDLQLTSSPLPSGSGHADLFIALADNYDETQVGGGENSGHKLQHVAVLRNLRKVAKLSPSGGEANVRLPLSASAGSGQRVVAFVQEPDFGKVLGAAVLVLPKP